MATNDPAGAGRPGDQRRQTPSSAAGGRKAAAGTESRRRGDTLPGSGPADLPERFGRYRVLKKLGGGGMGTVYLVENTELERQEALKVPHFEAGTTPDARERFLREARSAAKLDHPNLCQVYDVGVQDGVCFLTMRYLDGKPLSDYTGKAQPPRKVVEIVTKLAQALDYAHGKGVIHRDLKPSNVIICAGLGPVVMDFGLAKQTLQSGRKLTRMGTMLGTPAYMPPEQVKGDLDQIGPASDVYRLGVILYELLAGRVPFEGTTEEVFGRILYTEAAPPSVLRPGLNPALDALCLKALAKAPQDRYPAMKAFVAALVDYLRATPPAEGGGGLVATTAAPASIFQAATLAPGKVTPAAAPARGSSPPAPTLRRSKAPSSVRKPAGTRQGNPQVTVVAGKDQEKGRGSGGILLGCAVCVVLLLLLGGLGAVGALVYVLDQKKSDSSVAVATTPAPAPPLTSSKPPDTDTAPPGTSSKPPSTDTAPPLTSSKPPSTDTAPPLTSSKPPSTDTAPPLTSSKPPATETAPVPPMPPEPIPSKADVPDPHILLNEDFKKVDIGSRPKGWDGDAFSVLQEEGRPCLTVTETKGLHYIALPKLAIKGDFVLDCELRLSGLGFFGSSNDQDFHLELGSPSSTPLTVLVNAQGAVKLDTAPVRNTEGFRPLENIRLRLTRREDVYNVSINGNVTSGKTIPGKGTFEEVRLGLPGAMPNAGFPAGRNISCLYSVKISLLDARGTEPATPTAGPVKPKRTPAETLRDGQDFKDVTAGTLPEGWVGNPESVCVQKGDAQPGLQLISGALGTVTLPPVQLDTGFYLKSELAMPDFTSEVLFQFEGTPRRIFLVEVLATGQVLVQKKVTLNATQAWKRNGPLNELMLERSRDSFVVKVNDVEIGSVPLTLAGGKFTVVKLGLSINPKSFRPESPRIQSLRVVPLKPEP